MMGSSRAFGRKRVDHETSQRARHSSTPRAAWSAQNNHKRGLIWRKHSIGTACVGLNIEFLYTSHNTRFRRTTASVSVLFAPTPTEAVTSCQHRFCLLAPTPTESVTDLLSTNAHLLTTSPTASATRILTTTHDLPPPSEQLT